MTQMISDEALIAKYPMTEVAGKMIQHNDILGKMMDPASGANLGEQLASMCRNNLKMTKKLAKVFIKAINQVNYDKQAPYLKALKKFMLLDDNLKQQRLEWVFGVPSLVSKK